ncbi:MAG: FAD-dependent monooxygenase [Chloroflexota bacterium]|nr:FAD-dependent monooxygenase [Chloroflexota bacterium]
MKVHVLGGGPAGLYASLLLKQAHPEWEIALHERNPAGATYGWGVVFSDRTLTALREADPTTYREITDAFVIWDAIDVLVKDQVIRCAGHTFAGIARRHLLDILQRRCAALGVDLHFDTVIDDPDTLRQDADLLIAADGVNSLTRQRHADAFRPRTEQGATRFIWFGTDKLYDAFTFLFKESAYGLFQVHAYPFDATMGTFIVECTEETWQRAGLTETDEAASVAFCEALFAEHLAGRHLHSNRSHWLQFVTLKNARWSHENIVLLGDAAHTAHFSIGSGTKMAMEDAIALATACDQQADLPTALRVYELGRKPRVEAIQRAAAESQRYFEHVSRYRRFAPLPFAFNLLTRSGRITYDSLRQRDPFFIGDVERAFQTTARVTNGDGNAMPPFVSPPAVFAPLRLRDMTLANRLVLAPISDYDAINGLPTERQAERLIAQAGGGAALLLTEPVAVSADGRITPGDTGLYRPEHAEAWARIVAAVHDASSARIALHLNHAGCRSSTRPRAEGLDKPLRDGNWPLLAASAIPYGSTNQTPKAMDCDDMDLICAAFVAAAQQGVQAGFDLLHLNMAHGYLLAGFLSPLTNRRADAYGGSLENRLRFPLALFDAVRAAWPAEKPLAVALSATDWAKGGNELADAVIIAHTLKEHGCDLIAVHAGQTTVAGKAVYDFEAFAGYSDVIRNDAGIPTLATAYTTMTGQANTLLAAGRADLCLFNPR